LTIFSAPDAPIGRVQILFGHQKQWSPHLDPACLECLSTTRGVSHCGLAIYIKENIKAKEELRKLKYFTMQKHT
jgi:hypothetical protein